VVKARRMDSEYAAREQVELRAGLPAAFTSVLARFGKILIETWIEGRPLNEMSPSKPLTRQAGELLAMLHTRERAGGRSLPFSADVSGLKDETLSGLRWLVVSGALDATAVDCLSALVERGAPDEAPHCLIHTDYCAENLVVDASGRLFVVDNERFRFGPAAMDRARTWYRWGWSEPGAPAWQWEAFCEAYQAAGGERETPGHDSFWRIAAIVVSAVVRLRTGYPDASVPLIRLREMVRAHSDAGNFET
jgi:aminoglycoside phosphotransferase (APT) family kinase protein